MATAFLFASCNKEQTPQPQIDAAKQTSVSSASTQAPPTGSSIKGNSQANKVIYYATFDEWGHASAGCAGWGLCNFYDCWFCEGGGANTEGVHRAQVVFDKATGEGEFIIELDPSKSIEQDAIVKRSTFYVDQDINNPNSILHAGAYPFDPSVGSSGGYKLSITVTKP